MAKAGNDGWVNDAADVFSAAWREKYGEYKEAYELMKQARNEVEAIALAELSKRGMPETHTALFGYRWGFSFKVVPANEKKAAKPAKASINLADYFAAADQSGVRR